MAAKVFTRPPKHKNANVDSDLTPSIKINSKWITDLNVPCRTMNLLAGDTEEDVSDLGLSLKDLERLQKAWLMKGERKKRRVISQASLKLKVAPWNSAQRRKKRQEKDLRKSYKTHI